MKLLTLVLASALLAGIAFGHSDPAGDIHPYVTTSNGLFVVTATENYFPSNPNVIGELVMDLNPKGKQISIRRKETPKPEFKPYRWYSFMDRLPEEQNGIERNVGDTTYIIPEYSRKHGGSPSVIELLEDSHIVRELKWNSPDVQSIEDVVIKDGKLFFWVTRNEGSDDVQMWIHRFSMQTWEEEAGAQFILEPCTIWGMPVCSNLIVHKGTCYVAAISKAFIGHKLVLGSWDGSGKVCDTKVLTRKIDWNTSLHMANLDEHALIAYHYPGDKNRDATVKTVHFKLK